MVTIRPTEPLMHLAGQIRSNVGHKAPNVVILCIIVSDERRCFIRPSPFLLLDALNSTVLEPPL